MTMLAAVRAVLRRGSTMSALIQSRRLFGRAFSECEHA